jgi:hypothetical protein
MRRTRITDQDALLRQSRTDQPGRNEPHHRDRDEVLHAQPFHMVCARIAGSTGNCVTRMPVGDFYAIETDQQVQALVQVNLTSVQGLQSTSYTAITRSQRSCKSSPATVFAGATGGGGGIRTHGTLSRTSVFKTGALNHSATPPTPLL